MRESWKNPQRVNEKIQSAALQQFLYVPVLWVFFSESKLGDGPNEGHIFLFRVAYAILNQHHNIAQLTQGIC